MGEGGSLINLGELSKPATVLIEKIADATGGLCKPWQIKRVAKAEAEARKIKALAGIEVNELQQRALIRMLGEEAKRQENMERIAAGAVDLIEPAAEPEKMDEDWIAHFFEKCRIVSNEEMQSLWSRLLAGEANRAGSFSKKTLDVVSLLSREDADLFTKLCSFTVQGVPKEGVVAVIFSSGDEEPYGNAGLGFGRLQQLQTLDLVYLVSPTRAQYTLTDLPGVLRFRYHDIPIQIDFKAKSGNELNVGSVILTSAGIQLAPISGAKPTPGFAEYMTSVFRGQVCVVDARIVRSG